MRRRTFVCLTIFLLFSAVFLCGNVLRAEAATDVSGDITTHTTWKKSASPYVVHGEVDALAGTTLTIEPGVIVKFDDDARLRVFGTLNAAGTLGEQIYFTSLYDDTVGGDTNGDGDESFPLFIDWSEVRLVGGEFSISNTNFSYAHRGITAEGAHGTLESVTVNHGGDGMVIKENSSVSIKNSRFTDLFDYGITVWNKSTLSMHDSTISNVQHYDALTVFNESSLDIQNVSIRDVYSDTLDIFNNSKAIVRNTTMQDIHGSNAIVLFNGSELSFENSILKDVFSTRRPDAAIAAFNSPTGYPPTKLTITDSLIDGGNQDGITIFESVNATIKNTQIRNFEGSGVDVFNHPTVAIVDSEIGGNGVGIKSYGPADVTMTNSTIKDNSEYGVDNSEGGGAVRAANNWWGDASGPYSAVSNPGGRGNGIVGPVEFTPWLRAVPGTITKPTCCSNVIFIPGTGGSRLYTDGIFSENQLWEPNIFSDVEDLYLRSDGASISGIYTDDIIGRTNVFSPKDVNIYKSFIDTMNGLVATGTIQGWKGLPYDWRMDARDVATKDIAVRGGKTYKMADEVIASAQNSKTGKVTIITHSNGASIAKYLTNELARRGYGDLVDKLIFVAAPQLGTPSAIATLLHGDDQRLGGGWVMNAPMARRLAYNMPSLYPLLPSSTYFSSANPASGVITFDPTLDNVNNWRNLYGDEVTTYSELKDFLLATRDHRPLVGQLDIVSPLVANQALLDKAEAIHNEIDSWRPASSTEVIQVIGEGIGTVSGIKYVGKKDCVLIIFSCDYVLDHEPIVTFDGDKTVIDRSASFLPMKTYYVDMGKYNENIKTEDDKALKDHKTILEISYLENLIKSIIQNNTDVFSLPRYVSINKPLLGDFVIASVHSPVNLDIYDSIGNHTGIASTSPNVNQAFTIVEEGIPNSSYLQFGEGKYIILPKDGTYNVKIDATGSGAFTFRVDQSTDKSIVFENIPVATSTLATLSLQNGATEKLSVDFDGDGKQDTLLATSTATFNQLLFLESMKLAVQEFNLPKKTEKQIIKKLDDKIDLIKKGKLKKVEKQIENFIKKLEKEKNKMRKKDSKAANFIVESLEELLDNLK